MEHKLTIIILSLNYSALTPLHLHSRQPHNLERVVFHFSLVHLDEKRVTGVEQGNWRQLCVRLILLYFIQPFK